MTASQAVHLIEQFAAQCPFAIWILDSRGVAIFANPKLHELLEIHSSPSGAIGMNILKLPSIEKVGLKESRDRLLAGENVATTIRLDDPREFGGDRLAIGRKEPLTLRTVAYVLKSSTQTIEHYVIFLEDVTESRSRHAALEAQAHDVQTFLRSKKSRRAQLDRLKSESDTLRSRISALGETPKS